MRALRAAALFFCLLVLVAWQAAASASPVGYWTMVDDDGKRVTGTLQVQERGGKLFGKIVYIADPKERDSRCTECDGAKKGKPILGMEILRDMKKDGGEYTGGYILDPENGKEYRCIVSLTEGGKKLKVRGYIGISLIGRTQVWSRGKAP